MMASEVDPSRETQAKLLPIGTLVAKSEKDSQHGLDWALIQMKSGIPQDEIGVWWMQGENLESRRYIFPTTTSKAVSDEEVLITTGSFTTVKGRLSINPIFLRPSGSRVFLEIWAIDTEQRLGTLWICNHSLTAGRTA